MHVRTPTTQLRNSALTTYYVFDIPDIDGTSTTELPYLEGLFTGWFVGDIFGDELATTLMFQSVRTVALVNSFGLQNPATHDATVGEMNLLLGTANLALDGLEVTGLI